jgi:hypothetical protein
MQGLEFKPQYHQKKEISHFRMDIIQITTTTKNAGEDIKKRETQILLVRL